MGETFKSAEEFYKVFRAFLDRASVDPLLIPKVKRIDLILRITCADPETCITLHIGDPALDDGRAFSFQMGDETVAADHKAPHASMTQSADFLHRLWCGLEHPGSAVINGKIKTAGNYIRVLALFPTFRPIFRTYRETLSDLGLKSMILEKTT